MTSTMYTLGRQFYSYKIKIKKLYNIKAMLRSVNMHYRLVSYSQTTLYSSDSPFRYAKQLHYK
jgi:hypothetical protein